MLRSSSSHLWFGVSLGILAFGYGTLLYSRATGHQVFGEIIERADTNEKIVALTFDDGPNPPFTNQALQSLARYDAKATFFMVGQQIEKHPETVRAVIAQGHQVGNHSYTHRHLVFKPLSVYRDEIERTDRLIRNHGYTGEIFFRSRAGMKLVGLPWVLWQQGKRTVLYDIRSTPRDYRRPAPDRIAHSILEKVRPGSIILLHDGGGDRPESMAAAETILRELTLQGYRFLTVSELLKRSLPRAPSFPAI